MSTFETKDEEIAWLKSGISHLQHSVDEYQELRRNLAARIATLEAENARLKELTTWSPISEKHKDGWQWRVGRQNALSFIQMDGWYDEKRGIWVGEDRVTPLYIHPTHAAPLLPPPVKGDEE